MQPDVTWSVTNVQPGTGQNDSGQFVQGERISYQISGLGQSGTVFVPAGTTVEATKAMIHADALRLAAIRNLSSGN